MFNKTWGTFWQNIYLIPCRVFDLWRHLLTSFCSISLILPLHRLFGQLDSNFTKYLQGIKLFNVTWGILWKNLFLIQCRVFDSWRQLWRHFALSHQLVYLIAFLSDLTWFLRNIYDESNCSTRLKNILAKSLFDRMSRFLLMTSFLTSFCSISLTFPLNRLFEDFNLIFTKYL